MNAVFAHSREILEMVLLAILACYFGLRSDGYWSAFFNALATSALWVFPGMLLDAMTERDVVGMAYIAAAPCWGLLAVLVRSGVHLVFRLKGRCFPVNESVHQSWLVVVPTWLGRTLGRLHAKVFLKGKG